MGRNADHQLDARQLENRELADRVVSLGEYRLSRRIDGWLPCRGACCARVVASSRRPAGEVVDLTRRRGSGREPRPPPASR